MTVMGVPSHVEIQGEGDPVLLLHGWGTSAQNWLPLIRDLSREHMVIAPDFPGHGETGRPPEPWGVPEYMLWTEALLDQLQLPRVQIVAHSFGGRVTLMLASAYPDRVHRVVITGGAGLRPRKTVKSRLRGISYKVLKSFAANNEPLRRKLQAKYGSADYNALDDEMKKTFVKVVNLDLRSTLARIHAPVLLVWGSEDTATPLYMGRIMEREIPDAGIVVFEGAGHYAYLDRYAEFYPIVRHFLARTDDGVKKA